MRSRKVKGLNFSKAECFLKPNVLQLPITILVRSKSVSHTLDGVQDKGTEIVGRIGPPSTASPMMRLNITAIDNRVS